MTQLAQFNIGRLKAPTDDPRVADFMANLDRINRLGRRMPGFVWMLEGDAGEGSTDIKIGGDPLMIPNLTVWEDVESFERFVWGTVHKQFYDRRAEWFEALGELHFVMWWIEDGHRPTVDEGMARLDYLKAHGDGDHAFGWAHLKDARLWRAGQCAPRAAE